jgi:hypothetical protein
MLPISIKHGSFNQVLRNYRHFKKDEENTLQIRIIVRGDLIRNSR